MLMSNNFIHWVNLPLILKSHDTKRKGITMEIYLRKSQNLKYFIWCELLKKAMKMQIVHIACKSGSLVYLFLNVLCFNHTSKPWI